MSLFYGTDAMINAVVCRFLLLCAGIADEPLVDPVLVRHEYTEPHMGTRFQITFYAPGEAAAKRAAKAAFARIAQLDGIMSDYRPTSELMQLCQKAGGPPITVSEDLFIVLAKAQDISRSSDGAFDVTVGPVVRLWRAARKTKQMPDEQELKQALALVGYQNIRLDEKDRTVQLLKAGMQLDLGGIAKGYSADEALAALRKRGITRALVAAGGDIAVSGPPPGKEGWSIGIAPLEDPNKKPSRYLILRNGAVSTSGDAEQYVEIGGKRYSHIVDPRTGLGLVGRMSVTVVARRGILSDSLTKVVAVLGPERGFAILDGFDGVDSLVVRKTDKGLETVESKGFHLVPQKITTESPNDRRP
jgi:thiamine biosynthesis lipoprotein